jgi:hypothetical protein
MLLKKEAQRHKLVHTNIRANILIQSKFDPPLKVRFTKSCTALILSLF